jgi:hypothetical protein
MLIVHGPRVFLLGSTRHIVRNNTVEYVTLKSKAQHRSLNFLWCVISVHKLLKYVIRVLKLYSGL